MIKQKHILYTEQADAYAILKQLRTEYPFIRYSVVLAYMPQGKNVDPTFDSADTIYPNGSETVPKRFAISHRNRWIVGQIDAVICYIDHTWGGAYQAVALASRKQLPVINLGQHRIIRQE